MKDKKTRGFVIKNEVKPTRELSWKLNFHKSDCGTQDIVIPIKRTLNLLKRTEAIFKRVKISAINYKFNEDGLCAFQLVYSNGSKSSLVESQASKSDNLPLKQMVIYDEDVIHSVDIVYKQK